MTVPCLAGASLRTIVPRLLVVGVLGIVLASGFARTPAVGHSPVVFHRREAMTGFQQAGPDTTTARLHVATFNIHRGRGTDGVVNLGRTAALLKDCDLIGLNEVAVGWKKNQSDDLAVRLGMGGAFIGTEKQFWQTHIGNGVLTRVSPTSAVLVPLPGTKGKAFRTAIWMQFPFAGTNLQVLVTHVDADRDRDAQLQLVLDLFRGLTAPAILLGDLNATRAHPALQTLLSEPTVVDAGSLAKAAIDPDNRIDWILVRGLECESAEQVDNTASDHPLLRATLKLPPPETPSIRDSSGL